MPSKVSASVALVELVEERVRVGHLVLTLLRPPQADALIDEEAFDDDEFLPYWAELWPSGLALAEAVAALDLRGLRVLELGAGLGLPSLAAALGGADVLATDWAADAVALLPENAARNEASLRSAGARWDDPHELVAGAPWDLVLGADLLYEQRNADVLLELLPRLGATVLLADPGRPFERGFLERAAERWTIETAAGAPVRVHRLGLR
jgi:predicted nicotinamide N-methyase